MGIIPGTSARTTWNGRVEGEVRSTTSGSPNSLELLKQRAVEVFDLAKGYPLGRAEEEAVVGAPAGALMQQQVIVGAGDLLRGGRLPCRRADERHPGDFLQGLRGRRGGAGMAGRAEAEAVLVVRDGQDHRSGLEREIDQRHLEPVAA